MKKIIIIILILITTGILFGKKYWAGVKPVVTESPVALMPGQNMTDLPLKIPDGFSLEVIANIPNARDIEADTEGNLYVSRPKDNAIARIIFDAEEKPSAELSVFNTLSFNKPHGLAFDPDHPAMLFVAEEDKISRIAINGNNQRKENVIDLPKGGRHTTRSLAFVGKELFVSIGSTCDVCQEQDSRHGTVMRVNLEKKILEPYATGLRNAVFIAKYPVNDTLWATEMGRDFLGNNLPPDEINLIEEGKNYGWPVCYGKNIHDTGFDKKTYIRNPCLEPFETPSAVDLPAHVAPLGLTFLVDEGWPEAYHHSMVVAYHGSWNSTKPVGYNIIRLAFDGKGNLLSPEDFISGWLTADNRAIGRPVDVLALPGGTMYISDDKAGLVYRLQYVGK